MKKTLLIILAVALSACTPTLQALFTPSLAPNQAALESLGSSNSVKVEAAPFGLIFKANQPKGGLVFYPGGRVDFRAYAPILRRIAEAGYTVALLQVSLDLAILEQDKAKVVLQAYPELGWAVAGHSLGGVAAANFATGNPVWGLVLWASFPQDDLSSRSIPTLALFGERDGLIDAARRSEEGKKLPQGASVQVVTGLNHAGFGGYGPQPGDLETTLPPEQNWDQVAKLTLAFLEQAFAK